MRTPYLLFMGDARDALAAKTARGIVHWRRHWCVGQFRLEGCRSRLNLPELTIDQGAAAGARTLVVGVANAGGVIPDHWVEALVRALAAGMDIASGMHNRLTDIPALRDAAARFGQLLFDVRHPKRTFAVGTGVKRRGKRLLPVGTDCSIGKMYTALAIEKEMGKRGVAADFRATGQSGILIAGGGVSVDAVVADFISGAVEWLSPENDPDHWDLIEGQGSLFHPSFAGVSLGLLHGAQPDALVLCHEPTRGHMRGLEGRPLPDLKACIDANLVAARLTNPEARCVGVCVDTSRLEPPEAGEILVKIENTLELPCVDPVRTGVEAIVDALV